MSDFSNYVRQLKEFIDTPEKTTSLASPNQIVVPSKKRLKLLWIGSSPLSPTKNARFSMYLIHELLNCKDWLDIVFCSTHKKTLLSVPKRKYPENLKVYDILPKTNKNEEEYEISKIITSELPDIVFLYEEIHHILSLLEFIRKRDLERSFRVWAFVDTSHSSVHPSLIDLLNREMDNIFVYSNEWKNMLKHLGVIRPIYEIKPHSSITNFHPRPKDICRTMLKLPQDAFIFIVSGTSHISGRLDLIVIAFSQLIVKFPTKPIFLLITSIVGENGEFPVFDIFRNELRRNHTLSDTFGDRLLVAGSTNENKGLYTDDEINVLYSASNVGINVSESSGFDMVSFEQMNVGLPQIVSKIPGHFFCNDTNSIILSPKLRTYNPTPSTTIWSDSLVVDSTDIQNAMEKYLLHNDLLFEKSISSKRSIETEYSTPSPIPIIELLKEIYNR